MLEALLAYYCAPAFAGIKPSNLVSLNKLKFPDLHKELCRLNNELNPNDIYIEILCECAERVLVIAYRRTILEKHLFLHGSRAFLSRYGYPKTGQLEACLAILKTRLGNDKFPHEIGVFLGYPLHDIYCFINHRGKDCLLVGEWKVYHTIEEAERLFCRFKSCRTALVRNVVQKGKTLAQIFRASA